MKPLAYCLLISTMVLVSASRIPTTRAEETKLESTTDPTWLDCDFEHDDWWRKWGLREQPKNTSLVSGPGSHGEIERFLQVVVREGEHMGTSFAYKFRQQNGEEPEEVYLRYDIKFDEDWRLAISGGKLPGFGGTYGRAGWGGRPVDGSDGWSARGLFDSRAGGDSTDIGFYCYHADMKGKYGSHFEFTPKLVHGRWYTVKMQCKLNTLGVDGGRGKNDGVLRGWIDGQLAFEKTDLRFRDVASLKIENIWMNVYHGGATPVPNQDIHLYLDNVVISREP